MACLILAPARPMEANSGAWCKAVLALAMTALALGAQAADSSKQFAPGFVGLPTHSKILVAPLDVELFEISMGGMLEPRADWTESARGFMKTQIEARRDGLGVDTAELKDEDADEFGELLSLHAAVAQSIEMHHFGSSEFKLPTKNGQLDWSFGDALKPIQDKSGTRYGLFIWIRDGYSSSARKAAFVVMAAFGVGLGMGQQSGYASLVDMQTGQVLWFNRIVRGHGDLREAGSAAETVDALLRDFPVSK
jgi:hypothetical protein